MYWNDSRATTAMGMFCMFSLRKMKRDLSGS